MRTMAVSELFTDKQIRDACEIYLKNRKKPGKLHSELLDRVVRPNMGQINQRAEQFNDPNYVAFALSFIIEARCESMILCARH